MKRCVSSLLKRKVAAGQAWRCKLCDELLDAFYEVDHIVPLQFNGSNKAENLQALCPGCHRKKTFNENILASSSAVCGCGKVFSSYFTCCVPLFVYYHPLLRRFRKRREAHICGDKG